MNYLKEGLTVTSLLSLILMIETALKHIGWLTKKSNNKALYFDSFGNLRPTSDLVKYLGAGSFIKYNYDRYQEYNIFECGHLCLKFLCGQLDVSSKYVL